jgi:hypothetical protein
MVDVQSLLKIINCLIDTVEQSTDVLRRCQLRDELGLYGDCCIYNEKDGSKVSWEAVEALRLGLELAVLQPTPFTAVEGDRVEPNEKNN